MAFWGNVKVAFSDIRIWIVKSIKYIYINQLRRKFLGLVIQITIWSSLNNSGMLVFVCFTLCIFWGEGVALFFNINVKPIPKKGVKRGGLKLFGGLFEVNINNL